MVSAGQKVGLSVAGAVSVTALWLFFIIYRARDALWNVRLPKKDVDARAYRYRSGDILLCSGSAEGSLFGAHGAINRVLSGTPWTHVALVYVNPRTHIPYVWDIDSRAARLLPLFSFLERFRGTVALRALESDDGGVVSDAAYRDVIRRRWGSPYTYDFWLSGLNRLEPGMVALPGTEPRHDGSYFCCDLAAETLEALGVCAFPRGKWAMERLSLRDFQSASLESQAAVYNLPLAPGWRFEDEVVLSLDAA